MEENTASKIMVTKNRRESHVSNFVVNIFVKHSITPFLSLLLNLPNSMYKIAKVIFFSRQLEKLSRDSCDRIECIFTL